MARELERQAAYYEAGELDVMTLEGLVDGIPVHEAANTEEGTKAILSYSSMFFLSSENP